VTGEDPFAGCEQEGDAGAMLHCLLQRHAALVSSMADNLSPRYKVSILNQCLLQRHAALVSQLQTTPTCYPNTNLSTLNQCLLQRHAALVRSTAEDCIMLPKFRTVTQGPLQCHAALVSLLAHPNMLSRY